MNQFFRAFGLLWILCPLQIASAQDQAWRLALLHCPALQATEFGLAGVLFSQAGNQAELRAFAESKYSYRDAEVLASFWKENLDESKAHIGRKILFGGAAVDGLEQDLRAGRTQALASLSQLRFFNENYSFRDAQTLAGFWGEPGPLEAKLRAERKIILGEEALLQAELQRANSKPPANTGSSPVRIGSVSDLRPAPGQSQGARRPEVSAHFSGRPLPNSAVLLVDSIDRTQEATFSPDHLTLRWIPTQDLEPGHHAVEIRAIGENGETLAKTWTFSLSRPNSGPQTNTPGGVDKFYDTNLRFGLDIPSGWLRQTGGGSLAFRMIKGDGTFEVATGPAQNPQAMVANAQNNLMQRGAQILNQYPAQLGSVAATRIDYALPGQRRFGLIVVCVTGQNQSFLIGAEASSLSGPIGGELKQVLRSFLINAR